MSNEDHNTNMHSLKFFFFGNSVWLFAGQTVHFLAKRLLTNLHSAKPVRTAQKSTEVN